MKTKTKLKLKNKSKRKSHWKAAGPCYLVLWWLLLLLLHQLCDCSQQVAMEIGSVLDIHARLGCHGNCLRDAGQHWSV